VLSQHFYKQNRTGDLMNRISEDVGKTRMYVGPAVMYTINTFIRFAIVIVYMYGVSPLLTLYTILPLPMLSYAIFKLSVRNQQAKYHIPAIFIKSIELLHRKSFRESGS
jgi:ATP-binding cassette subfamily B multidrug efflux pump